MASAKPAGENQVEGQQNWQNGKNETQGKRSRRKPSKAPETNEEERTHEEDMTELLKAMDVLKVMIMDMKSVQENFEGKIDDVQDSFRKTLADQSRKHDDKLLKMQEDLKEKHQMEKDIVCQELANRHHLKLLDIKKQCLELDQRNHRIIRNLEYVLQKVRKNHEITMQKNEEEKNYQGVRVGILKLDKKEMTHQIKTLERRVDNYKKRITDLEKAVQKREPVLVDQPDKLRSDGQDRQRNPGKDGNEELDVDKIVTKDLDKAKRKIIKLGGRVKFLESKVKASKPEIKKLENQIQHQETYILRLKEDLRDAVPLIDQPKKLRSKINILKRRYLEDEEEEKVQGDPKERLIDPKKKNQDLEMKEEETKDKPQGRFECVYCNLCHCKTYQDFSRQVPLQVQLQLSAGKDAHQRGMLFEANHKARERQLQEVAALAAAVRRK